MVLVVVVREAMHYVSFWTLAVASLVYSLGIYFREAIQNRRRQASLRHTDMTPTTWQAVIVGTPSGWLATSWRPRRLCTMLLPILVNPKP